MKLANGPFVQPVAAVDAAQGTSRKLAVSFLCAITLNIQTLQLAPDFEIPRRQFISALYLPDGSGQRSLLIIDDAQANTGNKILRVGAQGPLEEFDGLAIHALFQAGFSQQAIGLDMLGIVAQDILAMGHCFTVTILLNQILDSGHIVLQPNISHLFSSHH